ncbi:MAG: hypothetical protein JW793_03435 [Acidobacteria bacterium]|nr:hypothetical protein [Acidobacteriota bacterium]
MKKLCMVVSLIVCLLGTLNCSSTPPGTLAIDDVNAREGELLGQNVVVVGTAEIKTNMSTFNMFKVYQGGDFIWVAFDPDAVTMPPQGLDVRVTGTLGKKKFTAIGEQLYIDAASVAME